jgi:hypothetical protein
MMEESLVLYDTHLRNFPLTSWKSHPGFSVRKFDVLAKKRKKSSHQQQQQQADPRQQLSSSRSNCQIGTNHQTAVWNIVLFQGTIKRRKVFASAALRERVATVRTTDILFRKRGTLKRQSSEILIPFFEIFG